MSAATPPIDHPGRVIDPAAGVPNQVPEVLLELDGTVTLRMSAEQAETLAKMLARWESLMTMSARTLLNEIYEDTTDPAAPALYGVDAWDPSTWVNVMVNLLTARAAAQEPVMVRPGLPALHVVGGGGR